MDKQTFRVQEETELLNFLLENIDRGRNYVKGVLKRGQVQIDGHTETAFNTRLFPDQTVDVLKEAPVDHLLAGISILYEDEDIVVVDKEAGLLTMASKPDAKQYTAYRELTAYVQHIDPRSRIFIVHRLDRDTSGVLVFAKNEKAKNTLQNNWHKDVDERSYLALVEGTVEKDQDTITSYLKETKTHHVYTTSNSKDAKKAILHYSVMKKSNLNSLVKVDLETGRKNQIRVQFASIGHPVVGDKQYGASGDPIGRLGLHAYVLSFKHPTTEKLMRFEAPIPANLKIRG